MLLATRFFKTSFHGETLNEAYKEASSWVLENIIKRVEMGEVSYKIFKDKKADSPTLIIELYSLLDETQFIKSKCDRCKEFHDLFYINGQYQCESCNMQAHRAELVSKTEIQKGHYKSQLKRILYEE